MTEKSFTLEPGQAELIQVNQLLKLDLQIPVFQRPYDWRASQIDAFIADLEESIDTPLFLGLVVLHKQPNGKFSIIDGQQRLTTLMILLSALNAAPIKKIEVRDDDQFFFDGLLQSSKNLSAQTLSQRLMLNAQKTFSEKAKHLLDAASKSTCISYVAPQLAGATSLFERINLRGREISQFDLVKNRLIGWINVKDNALREDLEKVITQGYDAIYKILNPKISNETPIEFDVDRLLRVHWILFRSSTFKSADKVIDCIEKEKQDIIKSDDQLSDYVKRYIRTLYEVALIWIPLQEPDRLPTDVPAGTRGALYEFQRLGRSAELDPLIVAVVTKFGWQSEDATQFVRLCTLLSFRESLLKRQSNRGRSFKWTMAKDFYNQTLIDASGNQVCTVADISHQLFWKIKCWWDEAEISTLNPTAEKSGHQYAIESLDAESFYPEFRPITHYLFWEYGKTLNSKKSSEIFGSQHVQINQFNDDNEWAKFKKEWDVEHIFPKKPDVVAAREQRLLVQLRTHEKTMRPFLNSLGNLTVVPQGENRGLLSNSDFSTKREEMNERGEVRFNQLLDQSGYTGNMMDAPFWGRNNCNKRLLHIKDFATFRWGPKALKKLGIGEVDSRIQEYEDDEDDL
jgi:Protein of unknown function DUF262/Protein of unknown function (DUF1524)